MGRRLVALLLLLGAAIAARPAQAAQPAFACSPAQGYRLPTNFELVRRAELIVLARVVSGGRDVDAPDAMVTLEPVRILKGTLPAGPLRVRGAIEFNGRQVPSLPTPLRQSHFSTGMGACIRLVYAQGGLVLALFARSGDGLSTAFAPWARTVEDVEGPEGVWVRAADAYVAMQRGVADAGLGAAAEAGMARLREQAGDLAAQAIADDLLYYLFATGSGGRAAPVWLWADSLVSTVAMLPAPDQRSAIQLSCLRGQPGLRLDLIGAGSRVRELTLVAGGRRFEGEGEAATTLPNRMRSITAMIAFTPALFEALRTSPGPAGIEAAGRAPIVAAPGDTLQKLALRCAALVAPAPEAAPAR